ncbi:Uncharacterised protein [Chlamydia trachomatis]|nr:Uncharacterised protein [Chlamydia trachomatis]
MLHKELGTARPTRLDSRTYSPVGSQEALNIFCLVLFIVFGCQLKCQAPWNPDCLFVTRESVVNLEISTVLSEVSKISIWYGDAAVSRFS